MRDVLIAAAQFEARDGDKQYNLATIAALAARAAEQGAEIALFHECCISGYTFLQTLSRDELTALAEPVPEGPSTRRLIDLSRQLGIAVAAGLVERDGDQLFNCYAVVDTTGFVAKHRKIHAFISPYLSSGSSIDVFDIRGVRASVLTCYDNNLIENPRIAALKGAEMIFAPHVTCGLPSPMPGRGVIDRRLWENRHRDPVPLRLEFQGPKGRGWLMRWLPARAHDSGLYYIFTNAVGVDHDTIKSGGAMILDPYGEILAESAALGDDLVLALCTADKLELCGGRRYLRARRPELYAKLTEPLPAGQTAVTNPGWRLTGDRQPPQGGGAQP